MLLAPCLILHRKRMATTLIITFTKERKMVSPRILSKAAHEVAFFVGLVDHTLLIVRIHKMSITMVITFSMIIYTKESKSVIRDSMYGKEIL